VPYEKEEYSGVAAVHYYPDEARATLFILKPEEQLERLEGVETVSVRRPFHAGIGPYGFRAEFREARCEFEFEEGSLRCEEVG